LTVGNESYAMPPMVPGAEEGILRGMYVFRRASSTSTRRVQFLGSGAILNEVVRAADLLGDRFGVAADVWSVTSYGELRRDAVACERRNLLSPSVAPAVPYVQRCLEQTEGPVIAASDYTDAARRHRAAPSPPAFSRHRRLRKQRHARRAARLLRGGCPPCCPCRVEGPRG
jgi:pyruvate dehydrogenase E1 component